MQIEHLLRDVSFLAAERVVCGRIDFVAGLKYNLLPDLYLVFHPYSI